MECRTKFVASVEELIESFRVTEDFENPPLIHNVDNQFDKN